MTRRHVSFGIAGLIFGAVMGFVTAHEIYVGRRAADPHFGSGATASMAGAPAPAMGGSGPGGPAGMGGPGGGGDTGTMEQVQRELEALRTTIEQNPNDLPALTRLGNLYMDAGMFDRAAEYYARALSVDATLVDVRTDRGTCLRRLGRSEEALAEFQASAKQDPNHWRSWFNIGVVCLYDLQRYDDAESAFERVHELNPGSFDMDAVRDEIQKLRAQGATGAPS